MKKSIKVVGYILLVLLLLIGVILYKIYDYPVHSVEFDKSKFPKNEKMIGQAKKIASEKLNIDANKLQYITLPTYKYLLITFSENKSANYKMIFKNSDLILLYSSEWLIITSSDDSKNKAI